MALDFSGVHVQSLGKIADDPAGASSPIESFTQAGHFVTLEQMAAPPKMAAPIIGGPKGMGN